MFDLIRSNSTNARIDVLSGITVALALVPEAVAFAFVAGVEPMVGLYAAFMMAIIAAVFGGRPGMISGATGSMAVVMVALVASHGAQYLFAAVVLAGVIQIGAGILKLGKFIRMVPHPVMLGFVNGLAIVIFLAQLEQFHVKDAAGNMVLMQGGMMTTMVVLVALTMLIIHFLPKLTTAVPSSLVAIIVVTILVHLLNLDARTVIEFVRDMVPPSQAAAVTLEGELPSFAVPAVPFSLDTFYIILPYAIVLAAVGLIESLLTMSLIDDLTNTRGHGNRECIGQGLGNFTNGFFGGMGGCAMIGQSMININSGGRGRLSGITAGTVLLLLILFAAALIELIPLAALVGVMFMVVLGTFEWSSLRIIRKIPGTDAFILVLVSAVTVITDLATAVLVGVITSALVFAWKHAKNIEISIEDEDENHRVYVLRGPIFFGSVANFKELFNPEDDPKDVVIDFRTARVSDHSAIEALDYLAERYLAAGKELHLRGLAPECRKLLKRAGNLCEVNVLEDPNYHVATDLLG